MTRDHLRERYGEGVRETKYGTLEAYVWADGRVRTKNFKRTATKSTIQTWRNQRRVAESLGVDMSPDAPLPQTVGEELDAYEEAIAAKPSKDDRMRDLRAWLPMLGHLRRPQVT